MTPSTVDEKIHYALEAWKLTVQVQQHFNDLQLKIRNFAITFLAAVLGLSGLALKEDPKSWLPSVLVFIGVLAWGAFYLMDRHWYHRYLQSAVEQGGHIESFLYGATGAPVFGLTAGIKAGSGIPLYEGAPEKAPRERWRTRCWRGIARRLVKDGKIRSHHRINIFYGIVALGLCLLSVFYYWGAEERRAEARVAVAAPLAENKAGARLGGDSKDVTTPARGAQVDVTATGKALPHEQQRRAAPQSPREKRTVPSQPCCVDPCALPCCPSTKEPPGSR
jgi:hypothetical protein